MFDTPDLSPLCAASFVAIIAGLIALALGSWIRKSIEKRDQKKKDWLREFVWIVAIAVIPVSCVGSIALEIGASDPAPWFKPTTSNIVGKWTFSSDTMNSYKYWTNLTVPQHELVFNKDGTFYVDNLPSFWQDVDTYNKIGMGYFYSVPSYQWKK